MGAIKIYRVLPSSTFINLNVRKVIGFDENKLAYVRHHCRITIVLSCYRCLINTGVEKNELHLNIDYNVDHQGPML